jgi:hypothetical protein
VNCLCICAHSHGGPPQPAKQHCVLRGAAAQPLWPKQLYRPRTRYTKIGSTLAFASGLLGRNCRVTFVCVITYKRQLQKQAWDIGRQIHLQQSHLQFVSSSLLRSVSSSSPGHFCTRQNHQQVTSLLPASFIVTSNHVHHMHPKIEVQNTNLVNNFTV